LYASVHQCAPQSDLSFTFFFFSISCLPQTFDVREPSFLSHYWIPVLMGKWCCSWGAVKVFCLSVHKAPYCNALWL